MKSILLPAIIAFLISACIGEGIYINHLKTDIKTQQDTVRIAVADTLSEWEVFTLALMKVESEYDSTSVSSAGAKGYFQMTPIYVKEVNRMHKTEFTFDDVIDFNTAYIIFDLMQQAHNPDYDMDKALVIHNGDREWYKMRVYNEMKRISLYEEMRHKVKNI
jgi:hypothetical protein